MGINTHALLLLSIQQHSRIQSYEYACIETYIDDKKKRTTVDVSTFIEILRVSILCGAYDCTCAYVERAIISEVYSIWRPLNVVCIDNVQEGKRKRVEESQRWRNSVLGQAFTKSENWIFSNDAPIFMWTFEISFNTMRTFYDSKIKTNIIVNRIQLFH